MKCVNSLKIFGEKHGHKLLILRKNSDYEIYINYLDTSNKSHNLILSNESKKDIDFDMNKYSSKCINLKSLFITKNNNNFLPIKVILENQSQNKWPFPCFFVCDEVSSLIKGNKIKLKENDSLEYKSNLKINLQNVKRTRTYLSTWQLRNEKNRKFGDKIIFKIKVILDKKLILNNKYKKDYKIIYKI